MKARLGSENRSAYSDLAVNESSDMLVDPRKGIAVFDGLRFVADPMTREGLDRVLPLFPEEQIFMCREMDRTLRVRKGALALDVGTGCGVFAIWAARRGLRVVAIDVNSRAIELGRINADKNGIHVVENRGELREGSILFQQAQFDDKYVNQPDASYDVVFLNPPYNPTFPRLIAALHADAGQDAQLQFMRQIRLVPHVLRSSGVCIGNQMGIVAQGKTQAISTIDEIESAFGGNCSIRYTRMMQPTNDIPVGEFLRALYWPYVERGELEGQPIESYIKTVVRERDIRFALLYYEVKRAQQATRNYFEPRSRPGTTWSDRLWIHHCITDTAEHLQVRTVDSLSRGDPSSSSGTEIAHT